MRKCRKHKVELECMGGRSAHEDNWYCPVCNTINELETKNAELVAELDKVKGENERLLDIEVCSTRYVRESYPPECKGDLMRFNALVEALNQIGDS